MSQLNLNRIRVPTPTKNKKTKGDFTTSQLQTQKKSSIGRVIRKAAFFTLLATATPALLNAQVKQIWFPKDSTGGHIKITEQVYIEQKKEANQMPATIEFVGGFEVSIFQDNIYKPIKINDDITLSVSEQKMLLQKPFIENDKYVFFYAPPVDYGGVRVFKGILGVHRKKEPPPPTMSIP